MRVDYAVDVRPLAVNPHVKTRGWIWQSVALHDSKFAVDTHEIVHCDLLKQESKRSRPKSAITNSRRDLSGEARGVPLSRQHAAGQHNLLPDVPITARQLTVEITSQRGNGMLLFCHWLAPPS